MLHLQQAAVFALRLCQRVRRGRRAVGMAHLVAVLAPAVVKGVVEVAVVVEVLVPAGRARGGGRVGKGVCV